MSQMSPVTAEMMAEQHLKGSLVLRKAKRMFMNINQKEDGTNTLALSFFRRTLQKVMEKDTGIQRAARPDRTPVPGALPRCYTRLSPPAGLGEV